MRFLAWNIQAGGGGRLPLILDEIERREADVVALSEVTHNNLAELLMLLRDQGLIHIETPCRPGGPNSVLLASRLPFRVSESSAFHDPERWLAVELEDFDLRVLCVHVPSRGDHKFDGNGNGISAKRRKELFWDQLIEYAQRHRGDRVVMLGDFNTGLSEDTQGTTLFSDRMKILRLEKYVDTWRHQNPKAKEYTYYSKTKKRGTSEDYNGFRLDYIFVSRVLSEFIVNSNHVHGVRNGNLSDHSIVVTDLSIGPASALPSNVEEKSTSRCDTSTRQPPEYVDGWGELIRAHRKYLSVSQSCMATRLNMSERSFSDIECGRRPCPPGLLDSVEALVAEFDSAVASAVQAARAAATKSPPNGRIPVEVRESDGGWSHAVLCRAAVKGGLLMPVRASVQRAGWKRPGPQES